MARWRRDEIEGALELLRETALECGVAGEWHAWVDHIARTINWPCCLNAKEHPVHGEPLRAYTEARK